MSRRRHLEVEDIGEITVVHFVDKKILDENNINAIGEELIRLVDEMGKSKLLLNFSNVDFMSSAALGKLISLRNKVQGVQGKLALCGISNDIREIFVITNLEKLFEIFPDEQSGLQSF